VAGSLQDLHQPLVEQGHAGRCLLHVDGGFAARQWREGKVCRLTRGAESLEALLAVALRTAFGT
jgi:hypothetical protein